MTVVDVQNRINELLQDRGWTRYRLSQEMGVTQSSIDKMLVRDSFPKVETLISICKAFDISFGDFFSFDTSKKYSINMTPSDMSLIEKKHRLEKEQVDRLMVYADILLDHQDADLSKKK